MEALKFSQNHCRDLRRWYFYMVHLPHNYGCDLQGVTDLFTPYSASNVILL